MFYKKPIKISTNGYYLANKSGFSENINRTYNIYYMLIFNPHGLVGFAESENEFIEPDDEALMTFDKEIDYEEFCEVTRYSREGNNITIRLYQPDDHNAYEKRIVNKNNYFEWVGKIIDEYTMVLSYRKSYFNYALQEYTIDYFFKDLTFHLTK